MPARDLYHDAVKNALVKDGWTITDDPFRLSYGLGDVYVDLAAERIIAAERGAVRIAVEIKTFRGTSQIRDFEHALGQYLFYQSLLERLEPDRLLFLAIPDSIYVTTFEEMIVRPALEKFSPSILAFDEEKETITRWKQ